MAQISDYNEDVVYFDGVAYAPDATLPDLGGFVCTKSSGMIRGYEGLSTGVTQFKAACTYVADGSSALILDTGELMKFHDGEWVVVGGEA